MRQQSPWRGLYPLRLTASWVANSTTAYVPQSSTECRETTPNRMFQPIRRRRRAWRAAAETGLSNGRQTLRLLGQGLGCSWQKPYRQPHGLQRDNTVARPARVERSKRGSADEGIATKKQTRRWVVVGPQYCKSHGDSPVTRLYPTAFPWNGRKQSA